MYTVTREDGNDGFRMEKKDEKIIKRKRKHPLEKSSGYHGPSTVTTQHTFEETRG